jgi:hypothetical protein
MANNWKLNEIFDEQKKFKLEDLSKKFLKIS